MGTARQMMLLFALVSCAPEITPVAATNLRPEGSPDVLVVSVSGHCASCVGWSYNDEYLVDRGTPQAIANALRDQGLTTQVWDYADAFYTWESTKTGEVLVWGFLDLVAHLEWVEERWIADFDNPTRIVVVGHSHGVVWAHSAVMAADHVPVEVLVDLDGVCLSWEDDAGTVGLGDDWNQVIDSYIAEGGQDWWFDLSNPCDSWVVEDVDSLADIEDVVPDNARLNLEVLSSDWWLYDAQWNRRFDGSRSEVRSFVTSEGHGELLAPDGEAMGWVIPRVVEALAPAEPR